MRNVILVLALGITFIAISACKKETPAPPQQQQTQQPVIQQPSVTGRNGTVAETATADGYTFVLVDTGTDKFWAAAPEFTVKAGDAVVVTEGTEMTDYRSSGLDRTFEKILFVDSIALAGAAPAPQAMQAPTPVPAK